MNHLLKALPPVLVALVIAMAATGPEDTGSNISKWASTFGLDHLPSWLVAKAADGWLLSLGIGFLFLYSVFAWVIAPCVSRKLDIRRKERSKSLRIAYSNDVNSEGRYSIYKYSSSFLPRGMPRVGPTATSNEFYIGVQNVGNATLRNVALVIKYIAPPPNPINAYLTCVRTNSPNVDIPPGGEELFRVFTGFDENEDGYHCPNIISPEDYTNTIKYIKGIQHIGGYLYIEKDHCIPILKNNGNVVDLCAYADDSLPDLATAIINAKQKLSLFVYRHQETSRRVLKDVRGRF